MPIKSGLCVVVAMVLAFVLTACTANAPSLDSIRDTKLLDRRINETPRQKVIRECKQEAERFRVGCLHCHTTDKIEEIKSPDHLALSPVGSRAKIMRESPTFGLHQDCTTCHQTQFALNRNAERLFGPGGAKYKELQEQLKADR